MSTQHSGALIGIEMALRYRGSAWLRGPEDESGIVLCGTDRGLPFALAVVGLLGIPSRPLLDVLTAWRKSGASAGIANTVADALSIVAGVGSHAR